MLPQISKSTPKSPRLFPGHGSERTEFAGRTELAAIRFVQKLGIRPNLTGYQLLISSITLALKRPELLHSLTRGLYPAVAELHGCNVCSVERNIRKAIDSAFEYDADRIRSIFYFKVKKPYISEVISLAVETIRFEAADSANTDLFS